MRSVIMILCLLLSAMAMQPVASARIHIDNSGERTGPSTRGPKYPPLHGGGCCSEQCCRTGCC